MSVELNANKPIVMSTEAILAVKTANIAKTQTELEGQMALDLIASTSVDSANLPTVGNSGQNINIKV